MGRWDKTSVNAFLKDIINVLYRELVIYFLHCKSIWRYII